MLVNVNRFMANMERRATAFNPTKPIGFCIYCGESDSTLLTDEHIAPEGLQGDIVLKLASCAECAKLTSYSELRTLRGPLGAAREQFGLYGERRRGDRRETMQLQVLRKDWSVESLTIPTSEYPLAFRMPRFPAPRFLTPAHPDDADFLRKHDYRQNDTADGMRRIQEILQSDKRRDRVLLDMQIFELSKVIAKIAYGFCVYFLGPYNVRPFITDLITAPRDRAPNFLQFVGGAFCGGSAVENLTLTELGKCVVRVEPLGTASIVLARVQLLGPFKMPVYEVVVGELMPPRGGSLSPHIPTPSVPSLSYRELLSQSFTTVQSASEQSGSAVEGQRAS